MGKIADALMKHSKERLEPVRPPEPRSEVVLTIHDEDTLARYDRETGHLLTYSRESGQVDSARIEQLQQDGTIQRLLDSKLIYPTGKLTARGIEEASRLARTRGFSGTVRLLAPAAAESPTPSTDNRAVEFPAPEIDRAPTAPPSHGPATRIEPAAAPEPAAPVPPPASESVPAGAVAPDRTNGRVLDWTQVPPRRAMATRSASTRSERSRVDRSLVALLQPRSPEAEQFKILRTNILYPVAGQPPRSILVTSAAVGEGKTFTATNLAVSVALNINRHVLLIDADLRRPQVHRRFGLDDRPGLSEFLTDIRPLSNLLVKTPVPKLTLLPGGLPPDNPSELISSERMADLLAEVTGRYPDRLVVIDAPPPALAAETSVLVRQADGVLLVVRFCSTRDEALMDLIARVGDQKILGTVMNYIETPATQYYGYRTGGFLGRGATAPA